MTTKEKDYQRARRWKKDHPNETKEHNKKYRLKHSKKINEYHKKWILKNPEKRKAIVERSRLKHPNTRRNRQYGVDIAEVERKQNRRCAICREEKKLLGDHCHKTNKFRGLLCNDCNLGLGRFKDRVDLLLTAIKYLKK